jgi:pyruvate dehydrogenase phosphatase
MTGSCGLVAILTPLLLVVANVGDSEGVLLGGKKIMKINRRLNAGESFEQERLLKEFPGETDIIKCLKKTNYCYVKGELQPTRAFGDFYLKDRQYNFASLEQFSKPYITHKPEINWYNLSPYLGKSLVLGSDGLWD